MRYIADLHIHSRFSMATSSQLTPPFLDLWARKKGITVVGTGDAVHPGWVAELKEMLTDTGKGLYRLKKDYSLPEAGEWSGDIHFMLTAEISCIYKAQGAVRKVHNVIAAPDFATMEKIQKALDSLGNIRSDGRPILGLDSRDLLEIVLEAGNGAFLFPAHIWTPWFSVLGSKSGFDTIEQCYRDLSEHVFAAETGLSSDPAMNWKCSFLDRYTLISSSDAHSPENLGREATVFETELSYDAMVNALKSQKGLWGTIEYFPEEGKYHLDGHRACGVCWDPRVTRVNGGVCPVCNKRVTVGVLNRVCQLSDTEDLLLDQTRKPFHSLTSLKKVISEVTGRGVSTKTVSRRYEKLLGTLGSEFAILLDIPLDILGREDGSVAEGVERLRKRQVTLEGGYDGVYGTVRVLG
ncbi:MAG: endonuclease Q family protein [Chitinispirillaceae bacterium]